MSLDTSLDLDRSLTDDTKWQGDRLVFVVATDPGAARPVLRMLDGSRHAVTRLEPGIAPLVCTTFGQLRGLYLAARDLGGDPRSRTEEEQARLAIEARTHASDGARGVARSLVDHTSELHARGVVAEPVHGFASQWQVLAAVLPDARYVTIVRDPRCAPVTDGAASQKPDAATIARTWKETVDAAREAQRRVGTDRVLVLRLDELCQARGPERLCRFLDLDESFADAAPFRLATTPALPAEVVAEIEVLLADDLREAGFTLGPARPDAADAATDAADAATGATAGTEAPTDPSDRVPEEVVWRPQERRALGYLSVWRHVGHTLTRRRDLVWQLFKRDFLSTFRKSFLGLSWLLIAPMLGIVQWLIIQRNGLLVTSDAGVPYALYVLIGTTMWGLFLGLYTATKSSLTSASALLLQLRFPAEALVIQKMGQQAATFAASVVVTILALMFFGVSPSWQAIFLPLSLIPLVLFATAVGLLVAMVAVVAVDIDRFLTVFWGLALWLTPVVYNRKDITGLLSTIVTWNPMTYLVTAPRDLVLTGSIPNGGAFAASSVFSLLLFLVAVRLFHVSQPQLVERLV